MALDGKAVRSVPWPIPFKRLAGEIETFLVRCLVPGYRLDHSDPEVLVLMSATDSMVSCFSSRGATQQTEEREVWEDYDKKRGCWPA